MRALWKRWRKRRAIRRFRKEMTRAGWDLSAYTNAQLEEGSRRLAEIVSGSAVSWDQAAEAMTRLARASERAAASGRDLGAELDRMIANGIELEGPFRASDLGHVRSWLDRVDEKHHGDLPGYFAPGVYEDEDSDL